MFSTVQYKLASALSYFGYDSKPSEGLPEKIYKTLENQDFTTETPLNEHRITSKSPSFWQKVASLGMSYLVFSSGQSNLQQSPSDFTPWIPAVSFTTLSEPWAAPLTFMAGMSILPDVAHAQMTDTTFFKVFGGAAGDYGQALTATPEGDIIVVGRTTSFGAGSHDVLLSKFSSNGMLLWANTLGGANVDLGYALTATSEGDLIVAGFTESFGVGGYDVLLSKFSSNGTLVWANTLGGVNYDESRALTTTPEGDLIVAGSTRSFGAGDSDVLLSKFSSNGTFLWTNTLGGASIDVGQALTATPEGDIIIAGYTNSFGAGAYDMLLSKFSSNGTLVWANTLGGGSDEGWALTATTEGDIIVTGGTAFGVGGSNVLLAKLSSNGTLVWANTLSGASSDEGLALTATTEGDLIVAGRTSSFGAGSKDVLLSKFSSNGTLVWANAIGGVGSDEGFALTATSEGDIIVTGYTNSFSVGNTDVLLAKLNAQGVIENCSAWQSVTPQVQSITPNITDVTLNMTTGIPSWTSQDARSALNITDITNLLNQTIGCSVPLTSAASFDTSSSSTLIQTGGNQSPSLSFRTSSLPSPSTLKSTGSPASSTSGGATIPSITTFVYGESYSIIVNGQTIGTFYFTGGSGQLDSNNTNTLNIQLDGDIEDGETITLFTIPEGEEFQWEDIILSDESESRCITTEGVFTTTSEEEHSYQLIFEYESDECSQSMATLKLAAVPVLVGGVL